MVAKPTHSIPTPTASDHIVRECTSQEALNFETNKSVTLNRWVSAHPEPRARTKDGLWSTPVADDVGHRTGRYPQGGTALSTQVGGQLNPTWVEWLMGFPLEWTACMASATRSSRKSRKS